MTAKQDILKVVVLGPESTGKSTLCSLLAAHYKTKWCPEYARQYLLENGSDYAYEDLEKIAAGQLLLEESTAAEVMENSSTANTPPLLIIDTDLYVMKVWYEFVFDRCPPQLLEQVSQQQRHLYLLCNIDLPWVADELREYPDLESREKLFHMYKDIMENQHVPWVLVSGDHHERLRIAIRAVDKLLAL